MRDCSQSFCKNIFIKFCENIWRKLVVLGGKTAIVFAGMQFLLIQPAAQAQTQLVDSQKAKTQAKMQSKNQAKSQANSQAKSQPNSRANSRTKAQGETQSKTVTEAPTKNSPKKAIGTSAEKLAIPASNKRPADQALIPMSGRSLNRNRQVPSNPNSVPSRRELTAGVSSSEILTQNAKYLGLVGVGSQTTGVAFLVGPQSVATSFRNVARAWDQELPIFFEIQGRRYPVKIMSVDVERGLAVAQTSVSFPWFYARPLSVQRSACVYALGFDSQGRVHIGNPAAFSQENSGAPCFDEQAHLAGLLGSRRSSASSGSAELVRPVEILSQLLERMQNRGTASFPDWKKQVRAQVLSAHDQAVGRFKSLQNLLEPCQIGSAPEDSWRLSAWSTRQCELPKTPDLGLAFDVGRASWLIEQSTRRESSMLEDVRPLSLYREWEKSSGVATQALCEKSLVSTPLGSADLFLCRHLSDAQLGLYSTYVQWSLRDAQRPLEMALSLRGFDSKSTLDLIQKLSQNFRRLE